LLVLPRDAKFENDQEDAPLSLGKKIKHIITSLITPNADRRIAISCSYSVAKILIAVGQLLFAVATLYRTRGNQVVTPWDPSLLFSASRLLWERGDIVPGLYPILA
jgi:hypothetical protein